MLAFNFVKTRLGDTNVMIVPVLPEGKTRVQISPEIAERLKFHLEQGDFAAKFEDITADFLKVGDKTLKLIFVGLGEKRSLTSEKLKTLGAKTYLALGPVTGRSIGYLYDEQVLNAASQLKFLEGFALRNYFDARYKTGESIKDERAKILDQLTIIGPVLASTKKTLDRMLIIVDATHMARELIATPAADLRPDDLANTAKTIVKNSDNLEIKVLTKSDLEKEGMNLLLAVNRGSAHEPRLIIMTLNPDRKDKPIVLVGKGITFDAGGYDIKTSGSMEIMHIDMAGGAAVICALKALSQIGIRRKVIGIVPATENLISGDAYKPSDIIRSHSGQTVEVGNTDAEGRLILADALSYGLRFNPAVIVDLATLTGACMTALGERYAGLFSENRQLIKDIQKAAEISGDKVWQLPLDAEFKDTMKSKIADLHNVGSLDRIAGASTGAAFLSYFVGKTPWAHIDIAGPTHQSKESEAWNPASGITGYGVALLVELLTHLPR